MPSTPALDASPPPRGYAGRVVSSDRMRLDEARVLPAFLLGLMIREAVVQRHACPRTSAARLIPRQP